MKRHVAAMTAAIAVISTNASAQPPARAQASQPIVHSGLFIMSPDGKTSGSAVQTGEYVGDDLSGTLTLTPCAGVGASSPGRPVSAFATDVLSMSGKVLEMNDQHASVQLGWRRTRRAGQDETSPEQLTTLTLKRGERHTIETITVPASGSCAARTVALDVVFASRSELYGMSDADFARASSGGGGGGSARAGGRVPYVQGSSQRAAEGGAISSSGGGTGHPGTQRLAADLWLVRSTPGAAEETLHVTSRLIPMPVAYAFAPLTIQGATGAVTVKVEGTIEAGLSPEGEQRLHFTASRSVTTLTSSRPARDGKSAIEGSTKTTLKMPGPDEVLSFEMPPLRTADGATLPDRLSIRVRVGAQAGR